MVRVGLECLLQERLSLLQGRRAALCCNPTAILPDFRHAVDVVHAQPGVELKRLFGPEHGVRGAAQDMVAVAGEAVDADTGLPVVSLYGEDEASLKPSPEHLQDLDVLIFDIQDVGSRYYTYVYTLAYCLEACAEAGVQVLVCDRPNPIRGDRREGNLVDLPAYRSFVGRFALPNRHGLTTGELAHWFCGQLGIPNNEDALLVIPCRGWRRDQWFDRSGLPWVMPSPNMPTPDTALVYPGQCLLEGTNVSEGRGTTRPFELCGAPWIRPRALKREMDRLAGKWALEGVAFRACALQPTFQKFAGQVCGGLQLHVTDRERYAPLATSVALLIALRRLYGDAFAWRTERYEFVSDRLAIDLLSGDTSIRELVDGNGELPELQALWRERESAFSASISSCLLYDAKA
ncbi:MAG: DUF1343 domain-containing protein [Gammaproteobacteria bacterium]|nr:DUF1343 domain-containing protein [Gammaproteobacteria bacterium]